MGLFSILPPSFEYIEKAITWTFLVLALITFGPWVLVLIYDILLYLWRLTAYEFPVFGGKARGKGRPRAPSLTERPGGGKRRLSSLVQGQSGMGFDGSDGVWEEEDKGEDSNGKASGTEIADDSRRRTRVEGQSDERG